MEPRFVTAHLNTGDWPAIVTKENPDETLNVMVFSDGGVVQRFNVPAYVPEPGDEPEDKVGFYS